MILYYATTILFVAAQIHALPEQVGNKTSEWQYFTKDPVHGNEVNDDVPRAAKSSADANNELGSGEGKANLGAPSTDHGKNISKGGRRELSLGTPRKQSQENGASLKTYQAEKITYSHDHVAQNWPLGIIPYYLDTESFDSILATRVRSVMDYLESSSCLRFKPLENVDQPNYTWINITNRNRERECAHNVKVSASGEVRLILGLECLKSREVLHSLLHAIGFKDEVTHPYRDQYIRVMWENIQPRYLRLFRLARIDEHSLVEYDPMSVMHFHDRAFSKNGRATIAPTMSGLQIHPSDKLSQLDKMKLRLTFGHECSRRTVDNLFDTCKSVLHDEKNGNVQESGNKNEQSKEKSKEKDKTSEDEDKSPEVKALFTESKQQSSETEAKPPEVEALFTESKQQSSETEAKSPEIKALFTDPKQKSPETEAKSPEIKALFTEPKKQSSEIIETQISPEKLKERRRAGPAETYSKKKTKIYSPAAKGLNTELQIDVPNVNSNVVNFCDAMSLCNLVLQRSFASK